MARQSNTSISTPKKPSRLLAVVALVVAFALPFILVKSFPHKNRTFDDSIPLALPIVEGTEENSLEDTEENLEDSSSSNEEVYKSISKATKEQLRKKSLPEAKAEWKLIKTQAHDSLANVFSRAGLKTNILHSLLTDLRQHKDELTKLKPNQTIQLLIKDHLLEKMIVPSSNMHYLIITKEGSHYISKLNKPKMNSYNHFLTATIKGSLYSTAKKENIPYTLIKQMTEIFTWDINFARDVKPGDRFTMIYQAYYLENKLVSTGNILAVSYTSQSKRLDAVRYVNNWGQAEYYNSQGRSFKKSFIRYPLRFSHISSAFSLSRYHPILHYRRAHKGVDLAARIGTPIQATGDGRIVLIGRQNGYGNMIKIKHSKTYSTVYAHMLKFQKNLSRGGFVKRGQIIGYVGQTGLAAGPHCHYEFHVNNQAKNPTTIDLPRGNPLSGKDLIKFKANSTNLLAQLKNFESAHLAKKIG